ncbi:MAG TPA: NAD(P)/FAD-dependent oxidoreductase [Candidatus Acidoferrales bacterium]|nr:NAD(P)/FAD-dependent oxidoreductase [Candidatus Acidoferrales bacterium]
MADRAAPAPGETPAMGTGRRMEHFDVLIVGAGLSGIGAACHLQAGSPSRTFAILEGRAASGGTWDLFRYPGVRSDSDMYTLGYHFRPWREAKAIADGPSILSYIRETARDYGVDRSIRYGHQVKRASWSSREALWTVEAAGPEGKPVRLTTNFLYMCSGYYDYEEGYMPGWPGMESYSGRFVHPQQWPENLDFQGKEIVVIGSGATAVTLVPALAEKAGHVTMLQRSPTYVVARPAEDAIANWLRRILPARVAYGLVRWKNVLLGMYFYNLTRRKPAEAKKMILELTQKELGPAYDVAKHFTPRYNPWDQRLCLVPDADLFSAIRTGKASVVTDEIASFTETGVKLKSGDELKADIVVTATGLKLKLLGGMQVLVDGALMNPSRAMTYKGMMYSDIPNLASTFGYTNASWTLKADLTAGYVCRLLNHMYAHGYDYCTPRRRDPSIAEEPAINFSSGYILRGSNVLPKQGSKRPWRLHQNYALDMLDLKFARIDDGTMEFTRLRSAERAG